MKTTIQVEGMMCEHCENRVQQALQALKGVKASKASSANGNVEVEYEEGLVKEEALRQAIEDAGYDVK